MSFYGRPVGLPPPDSWYGLSGSPVWLPGTAQEYQPVESVEQYVADDGVAPTFAFPPLDGGIQTIKQSDVAFDVSHDDLQNPSPTEIFSTPFIPQCPPRRKKNPSSTSSASTSISSSAASTWSSVHTDDDCLTIVPASSDSRNPSPSTALVSPHSMMCLGPQCSRAFTSHDALDEHIRTVHTHTCKWIGCSHPSFASRDGLIWHVESEHLLVCPLKGCSEDGFKDARMLRNHIAVGHPEAGKDGIKDWQLSRQVTAEKTEMSQDQQDAKYPPNAATTRSGKALASEDDREREDLTRAKRRYQEDVRSVVVKRAKKIFAQPDSVACSLCSATFRNNEELKRHTTKMHRQYLSAKTKEHPAASPAAPTPSSLASLAQATTSWAVPQPSLGVPQPSLGVPQPSLGEGAVGAPLTPSNVQVNVQVPFPLVFEHAILPFLTAFLPRWIGPRHVISVARGRGPQARRICIMSPKPISRARKVLIAKHVCDLLSLPEGLTHRANTSLIFPVGTVDRTNGSSCWARGLSREQMDDICDPRNPFYFPSLCMGDSIGVSGTEDFEETTATLGPCLSVGGGSYWLANFHPFLDAYRSADPVVVEHPSAQDRDPCISESHDAVASKADFSIGNVRVTSGMTLKTTRISHEPYWEECGAEQPLVVTDWALVDARSAQANILRRLPSDHPRRAAPEPEPLIRTTSTIVPGASVVSSGRTSGYGAGQVCEIPAYISGKENGTEKATREWFVEEPYPCDDEDEWIRGGIGIHGDSGAAIIDAETSALIGQLWGRNKYWGPGPRHTFFTPIADIFDDIQEKCGQQTRPQLPQHRDEGDCYPVEPPCRTCYDAYRNLYSRRSSRVSLVSMIPGAFDTAAGGGEQDGATTIEAASELNTPRPLGDRHANAGLEEIGMTFGTVFWSAPTPSRTSQGIASPSINEMRSPYAQTLELDDIQATNHGASDLLRKRTSDRAFAASPRATTQATKRPRVVR